MSLGVHVSTSGSCPIVCVGSKCSLLIVQHGVRLVSLWILGGDHVVECHRY